MRSAGTSGRYAGLECSQWASVDTEVKQRDLHERLLAMGSILAAAEVQEDWMTFIPNSTPDLTAVRSSDLLHVRRRRRRSSSTNGREAPKEEENAFPPNGISETSLAPYASLLHYRAGDFGLEDTVNVLNVTESPILTPPLLQLLPIGSPEGLLASFDYSYGGHRLSTPAC